MRTFKVNSKTKPQVGQGTLLCATPINPHSDNLRRLVLVTKHHPLGSSGIILNNPLGIRVHISGLGEHSKILDLNYGGPDDDTLSFLISLPSFHNGWNDTVYWSRSLNELKVLIDYINSDSITIHCYKGSVHWLRGELEEQVKNKQWWATDVYSIKQITNNSVDSWSAFAKKAGGFLAPLVDFHSPIIFS